MPETPERVDCPADRSTGAYRPTSNRQWRVADLQGARQLVVDGVVGATEVVEAMHHNISGLVPLVGNGRRGRKRGIAGFVYRSIRVVSRLVGLGAGALVEGVKPFLNTSGSNHTVSRRREAVIAALNGVLGDHLAASNNPLSISMRLRVDGCPVSPDRETLRRYVGSASARPLILLHGLCMNDLQWHRDGHDHGAALARDLGYAPLYVHYNTGRRIEENGRRFSELMERLVREWPEPSPNMAMIGHSMGGLVIRSAWDHAGRVGLTWPERLGTVVFLGTPHHGAPMERAGQWVDRALGRSPYTEPISRIGRMRSAGINDLCHGGGASDGSSTRSRTLPLPAGTTCFAIAASLHSRSGIRHREVPDDGLVPVASALGEHADPERCLEIPPSQQRLFAARSHFDLLSDPDVYEQIRRWLGKIEQDGG
ncbi:esterase/lipase family protein [Longibacter sp.]|uniref:esterase/lipase family protein n=1 Tax=Longibacter sp. TaxID=2045415 RepID=UPI003EB6E6DD